MKGEGREREGEGGFTYLHFDSILLLRSIILSIEGSYTWTRLVLHSVYSPMYNQGVPVQLQN